MKDYKELAVRFDEDLTANGVTHELHEFENSYSITFEWNKIMLFFSNNITLREGNCIISYSDSENYQQNVDIILVFIISEFYKMIGNKFKEMFDNEDSNT